MFESIFLSILIAEFGGGVVRVSKIAFVWVSESKTKEMGARFLRKALSFYPYKVHYILTDNGFEFCYDGFPRAGKQKRSSPLDKGFAGRVKLSIGELSSDTRGQTAW